MITDYIGHLSNIDVEVQFRDLLNVEIEIWIWRPSATDVAETDICLQEELIELQTTK